DRLLAPELFFPRANDIETGEFRIETECQSSRRGCTDGICHNAKTFWISLELIEENDLRIGRARRHFGDCTELEIPIRAVYTAQLTKLVDRSQIFTQVFIH